MNLFGTFILPLYYKTLFCLLICAIVLHELTHWVDWHFDNKRDPDGEAGTAFEKLAYGGSVGNEVSLESLKAKYAKAKWQPVYNVEVQ